MQGVTDLHTACAALCTDDLRACLFDHRCLGFACRLGEVIFLCLHRDASEAAASVRIAHFGDRVVLGE